jgi:hypothetical protein
MLFQFGLTGHLHRRSEGTGKKQGARCRDYLLQDSLVSGADTLLALVWLLGRF